ncbi:MAG: IS630 family transposase [bacterium]
MGIRFIQDKDREILEKWRKSNNKKRWQKAISILEFDTLSIDQISLKTEKPNCTIRKWIKLFNSNGIDNLMKDRKKRDESKRHAKREEKRKRIVEIFHQKPNIFGINRSNWNLTSLSLVYEKEYNESISSGTVRNLIKLSGYTMKKARQVLTSPDPDYREKVELLLKTLQSLKSDEMFFFIDELGPLRVKKYGGRIYIKKNTVKTIPQSQKYKGSITLAGALSATTNQMTWIYGKSKDTSSMIDLIEILFNQYYNKSKLYITWDAASWHKSNALIEWLDGFNFQTEKIKKGPIIYLIPLPSNSQFLDVIEAVFSGMKRAVIHHSDYQSEKEMKGAISLHFQERNEYFKENPKRVGKKIWEIDFFSDQNNIKSGTYREW